MSDSSLYYVGYGFELRALSISYLISGDTDGFYADASKQLVSLLVSQLLSFMLCTVYFNYKWAATRW